MKKLLIITVALCVTLFHFVQSKADEVKPLAVVSFEDVDSLIADVDYLGKVTGMAQLNKDAIEGGLKFLSGGPGLDLFDRKKPWGVVVLPAADGGIDYKSYLFMPVKNENDLMNALKNYIDTPKDAGNGVKSVTIQGNAKELFYKYQDGNIFIADKADYIAAVPNDPSILMGTLPKDYDIAVRVFVQNIPEAQRNDFIEDWKKAVEDGRVAQRPEEDDEAFALRKNIMLSMIKWFEGTANDLSSFTVGLNIDGAAKTTHLDFGMLAKAGTKIAAASNATSSFGGFIKPDQGVAWNMAAKLDAEMIEQRTAALNSLSMVAKKGIEKGEKGDVAEAKEIVEDFFNILTKTVETGKWDSAGTIAYSDKTSNGVFGGYVYDGAAAEALFNKISEKIKDQVTSIKTDVATHEGVKFHKIEVPVKELQAKKLFGDTLDVNVGIGPKAFYITFGKDALTMCKEAITASASAGEKKVEDFMVDASLTPIFTVNNAIEPSPPTKMALATLANANGKDHISFGTKEIENGHVLRLKVDEAVLKLVGVGVAAMQGGFGPPGGGPAGGGPGGFQPGL